MNRNMRRLPIETIRNGLLSEDQQVRSFALRYFTDRHSDDPETMNAATRMVDRYGESAIEPEFRDCRKLRQTEETVVWLIDRVATHAIEPGGQDEVLRTLVEVLLSADLDLLAAHADRIHGLGVLDASEFASFEKRLELRHADVGDCWRVLEDYCWAEGEYQEGDAIPEDRFFVNETIEAIVRGGPVDMERVRQWLVGPAEGQTTLEEEWRQIVATRIVAMMRDDQFVPEILRHLLLNDANDFLFNDSYLALERIGGLAVYRTLAAEDLHDDPFRDTLRIELLSTNGTDEAIAYLADRLANEDDPDRLNSLAAALIRQCVPGAISKTRQVLIRNRNEWNPMRISACSKPDLIAFADLSGERFPEYDQWQAEVAKGIDDFPFARLRAQLSETPEPAEFPVSDEPRLPIRNSPDDRRAGRNDPCPCGSGKKYKKCCLNKSGE